MESEPPFQETYKILLRNLMEEESAERVHHDHENSKNHSISDIEYELPVIDLSCLSLGDLCQEKCKREIADAASKWGFFQVVNHGISGEITARMRQQQVMLFRQPFHKKANIGKSLKLSSTDFCYRWGTPTATSLKQLSWSEAFRIPLSHISGLKEFNTNLSSTVEDFVEVASKLAQRIAEILAENLGLQSTFFVENCLPSSCYLRMNRYPPCPISSSKVLGLTPHTDSDFLTILNQYQVGGLLLVKDGEWVRVKPNPQALIINIGDLFQAWSNGVYKSIEHKVVTNQEVERFSIAYFFCPSYDAVIKSCMPPSIYRKFSFKEYRDQVQEDVKSTGSKIGLLRFLI
ncbi:gibberellin 2-beta-dioxygenase 8-like [Cornus florida]|uniref:gibberellin 2-beta-dioxygenase 8-like n=1 Tax=Cornus florida TaxID=4283 RepID=UPI00289FD22B|nr:gibberellin 2-beta-dioxygenase 8-like [Cornus florida]